MEKTLALLLMFLMYASRAAFSQHHCDSSPNSKLVENMARALQQEDVLLGVFEVPTDFRPVILSSGEFLENSFDYQTLTIRYNLSKLWTVKEIKGNIPSFIFTSSLYARKTGQKISPFHPMPGSQWILALRHFTNEFSWIQPKEVKELQATIVGKNWFQPYNGQLGIICQNWPRDNVTSNMNYLTLFDIFTNSDIQLPDDFAFMISFIENQKRRGMWTIEDMAVARHAIKTDFGKAVLEEIFATQKW